MSKENGKFCAILSYFLIGIIWYLLDDKMKRDSLAKYHVKQSLNLAIIGFIFSIALGIFSTIFTLITFGIGAILLVPLYAVIGIFWFVIWLIGIINAAKGKQEEVPIIGKFADKYLKI